MRHWIKHTTRFFLVTVGIITLTSFTIDATDALTGSQSALSILAKKAAESSCADGMVRIDRGEYSVCIDQFENSVHTECAIARPQSAMETKDNIAAAPCISQSIEGKVPWTYVTFHQAKELCAKRGMRLPKSDEWFDAALGTPADDSCNIDGSLKGSGTTEACVSYSGVHDMVGNVWEWVDEEIVDGQYHGRTLPPEGYVHDADFSGVAVATGGEMSALFDGDYFWHAESGSFAMMRGGYYDSKSDAGIYAVHTKTSPTFSGVAVGFRCVMNI